MSLDTVGRIAPKCSAHGGTILGCDPVDKVLDGTALDELIDALITDHQATLLAAEGM